MKQEFRMAQESRAKLTVSGSRKEAGSPEVREGPQGYGVGQEFSMA